MVGDQKGDFPNADASRCLWCGGELEGDGRCADCGRVETRVCACGQELAAADTRCPACGEPWQGIVRVRRRRKHRRLDAAQLSRYVALGVLVALAAAALLNSFIGGLALRNQNASATDLPESLGERAALAWETVADTFSSIGETTQERLGGALVFIFLGALGALVGILVYLRNEGIWFFAARDETRSSATPRRRRRV